MAGFLDDGKRAYFAESNGRVTVWDVVGGKELLRWTVEQSGARSELRFCVAAPDGKSFVVNRGPRQVARLDAATGKELWASPDLTPRGIVYPPVFTPDARALVLGITGFDHPKDSSLRGRLDLLRLDPTSGKVLARIEPKTASEGDVQWFDQPRVSSDGRTLLVRYGMTELFVVDLPNDKVVTRPLGFWAADVSPDGKWLVCDKGNGIAVHDAQTGNERFRVNTGTRTITSLRVLPDGKRVFVSAPGGKACLWALAPQPVPGQK
jgi:WD40 repeat protein